MWRPDVDDEPCADARISPQVIPPAELTVSEPERVPGGAPWIAGDEYRELAEAEWRRASPGHPASPGAPNAPKSAQPDSIPSGSERR